MVTAMPCTRCNGMGSRIESPCTTCRGEGRTNESTTLTIQIPAGVEDGSTMRLADRGPAGVRGGPNGRLFVHLRVTLDERFERHGDDLHHEAHIAFSQAALGADIEVPTLRATTNVEVEAGSANGTVHRIRHEGVEHLHGRGRGDLYVHLVVDVPSDLDDTSRDLLRQLAEHRGEAVKEHAGGLFSRRRSAKK
jgi:molecular chaperone DnaJ